MSYLRVVLTLATLALAESTFALQGARPDPSTPDGIRAQIRELQEQARIVSAACGGEQAVLPIYSQIMRLAEQLPRDERDPLDQGGDNCNSATVITSLPYIDCGTTQGRADDYAPPPAVCGPSSAPDVVYTYTPPFSRQFAVSLCGSSYNTLLHIWDGCPGTPGATLICCNDDSPFCSPQSCCDSVTLIANVTYYIIVDGAGGAAGNYVLHVNDAFMGCLATLCDTTCVVDCPPGAILENEACPASSPDTVNGGHCGQFYSDPISCGDVICGRAAANANVWDQDNFLVTISQPESLRWCVYAEFPVTITVSQYISYG